MQCVSNYFRSEIRKALRAKGETMYWLAKTAKVPYPRVHSFLERDKTITSDNLERMIKSLGITLRRE